MRVQLHLNIFFIFTQSRFTLISYVGVSCGQGEEPQRFFWSALGNPVDQRAYQETCLNLLETRLFISTGEKGHFTTIGQAGGKKERKRENK